MENKVLTKTDVVKTTRKNLIGFSKVIIKESSYKNIWFLLLFLGLGLSAAAQCSPVLGDQTTYGSASWIGYVYNPINATNPPTNSYVTTNYRGYITQPEIFNQDLGTGSLTGTNLCGTLTGQFAIRYKMQKNFTAGTYSFIVGGDDGYRLSFDGGATFPINSYVDHAYAATTTTMYLSGTTNLVLEYYEQGGLSRVSFSYGICSVTSTAPTSITGTTSFCAGNSTTLTANGGTIAYGATYEWGTGTVVGSNLIAGQNGVSITVTPAATTTYWVRRVDPAPCALTTAGITQAVTVLPVSTAPTALSGTTTLCLGSSATLTATGGSLAAGSNYEWGTGSVVGANIIAGQTTASMVVTPTTTTTYWVRMSDPSPCANKTAGVSVTVSVNIPAGDQTSYGNAAWIGYVYNQLDGANPPTNVFTASYRGYITEPELFDQDYTNGAISGPYVCGSYTDQFSIRFKMQKNFTAGYYTFTVGGDDGFRLSLDGGVTYAINNFTDHSYTTTSSATLYLSGSTNLVLDYYEQGGSSRVTFNYTACTAFSTAPTSITGASALCNGAGGTTLTATGGTAATGTTYQWGTGTTVGSTIVYTSTAATYYINPVATTTYWVRRLDTTAPCNQTTGGVSLIVTVATASTMPSSITASATTVCSGTTVTLTASGGTLGTGAVYQWGTGYAAGVNIISGQGASITINPTTTSGYWVRRMDPAPCNTATGQTTTTITVAQPSVNPTSISATASSCSGSSITLTAIGGTIGTNATYEWGTGSLIGSNAIVNNNSILYVSPIATTTYWVRLRDVAPCSAATAGLTQIVTVSVPSTTPTIVSGIATICSGSNTTLTASGGTTGTGAVYQWGSGSTVGSNIIAGQTSATIIVAPTSSGNFWVRRIDPAPCNTTTSATLKYITVTPISTDPTTITGTASTCTGSSTTLTATGGVTAAGGVFQWGTGSTIGSNIIAGQTTTTLTVSPTATTTYWVRRYDSGCSNYTNAVTQIVTVSPTTVAGSISSTTTTICKNKTPSGITLTGNVGGVVKWQYANDLAFTLGVTDIASTATILTSAQIGPLTTTRYFRAVVQSGSCLVANTTPISIIVPLPVTYNGSWSSAPNATTPVLISSNLTLSSDLNVCSCQVSSTAIIKVPANISLIVQNDITVAATANIIVEDKGSLVQVDDSAVNSGTITYKRNTTPLKQYDYTYWSSPLAGQTLSQFATSSVFYSFNSSINNWAYESGTTTMTTAKGYIVRAPNNLNYATPQTTQVVLNGTPNSGLITASIIKATGQTFNLIGNPYPSAIDIDQFLLDSSNGSAVSGTIYLWTHNTAISSSIPGNQVYNYTRDDYAKYNITGGVKTAATAVTGGVRPSGKVAAGQGFFIEANPALANGSYQATFNNSMRVAGNNDQFFKIKPTATTRIEPIVKNRIWINMSNNDGAYSEALVGYIGGATNDFDNLYDGKTMPAGNVISLYSVLNTNTLAIQGRTLPFDQEDIVPLGYTTTLTTDFTIALEDFDGLFSDQNIYLLDKTTGTYYDLKTQSFTFSTTSGTYNDRFELHYTNGLLGNNQYDASENSVQIIKKDKHVAIKTGNATIATVQLYDLLGKSIYTKTKIEASEFNTSDFNIAPQIIIVKVTLDTNEVITKKVLMN